MFFSSPMKAYNYINDFMYNEIETLYVIGGQQLYSWFLNENYFDYINLTTINH